MKLTTLNKQVVEEVPWGVYLWELPDGTVLGDDEGNYMMIASDRGDIDKLRALKQAARDFGYKEGRPRWMSGHRPVTADEYEEQLSRMKFGLVPDPLDYAAMRESAHAGRR